MTLDEKIGQMTQVDYDAIKKMLTTSSNILSVQFYAAAILNRMILPQKVGLIFMINIKTSHLKHV